MKWFSDEQDDQKQDDPGWLARFTNTPDSDPEGQRMALVMGLANMGQSIANANRPNLYGTVNFGNLLSSGVSGYVQGVGAQNLLRQREAVNRAKERMEQIKAQREQDNQSWENQRRLAQVRIATGKALPQDYYLAGGDKYFEGAASNQANMPYDKFKSNLAIDEDLAKRGMLRRKDGSVAPQQGYADANAYNVGAETLAKGLNTPMAVEAGGRVVVPGMAMGGPLSPGDITAQFESGSQGSKAIGYDKNGGTSYGKYQISSHTIPDFIDWLGNKGMAQQAETLRAVGKPDTGSSVGTMPTVWKSMVDQGMITDEMQDAFINDTHVMPAYSNLPQNLQQAVDADPRIASALNSTSVQHGPGGAARLFSSAEKKSDGTPEGFINTLYELRKNDFHSSSPQVQKSVARRFDQERDMLLGAGIQPAVDTGMNTAAGPQAQIQPGVIYQDERPTKDALAQAEKSEKENREQASKQRSANIVVQDIDRAIKGADYLTTGMGSVTASIPGTPARDLSSTLDTIKANIGFDKLQEMRRNSPTGGALGSVSDVELRHLQAVLGSLDQSQSKEQFVQNMIRLKETYLDIIHGPGNRPETSANAGSSAPKAYRPSLASFYR